VLCVPAIHTASCVVQDPLAEGCPNAEAAPKEAAAAPTASVAVGTEGERGKGAMGIKGGKRAKGGKGKHVANEQQSFQDFMAEATSVQPVPLSAAEVGHVCCSPPPTCLHVCCRLQSCQGVL
jgi:hypothetical protein